MKKNIRLIIEYDGSNYGGWQRQCNSPSIQQELEEGLFKLTGEETLVQGAGRTDSGVHARGQVANFFTNSSIPSHRFSLALNSVIPRDIRVVDSREVSPDFHSRFWAKARHYRYAMVIRPYGLAIGRDYYYHIPVQLDIRSMEEAAELFKGQHDFKAFQAAGSIAKSTTRTIHYSKLTWKDPYLYYDVVGNGFLYNMVRIMVGTLVHIGKGKIKVSHMENILNSGDRRLAGPTAPAQGLCLEKVYYDEDNLLIKSFN
ncbi:MAG: tRNA pseudouridine(38-40) synthase TruA [Clostridiales bacterium]|nr:tRNA pseudouridine(38-40) synthase TruA [Clostridiales bacterium]